jgi:hypothetical protein
MERMGGEGRGGGDGDLRGSVLGFSSALRWGEGLLFFAAAAVAAAVVVEVRVEIEGDAGIHGGDWVGVELLGWG